MTTSFQNRILGIVGRKGSGKSTYAAQVLRHCPRLFVFDVMRDHASWLPNTLEGLDSAFEFFDWCHRQQTFAAGYVPGDDLPLEFDQICQLVYHYGRMCFAVEEVAFVSKPGWLPPAFGKLVRTGRHQGVDLLWTAQRASEVSRTLTSATDVWIFYSQTEPRDLDAIAARCGRELAGRVAGLGLHDSFVYDVVSREVLRPSPRLLKREVAGA